MLEEDKAALQDANAWLVEQGASWGHPNAAGCWDRGGWGSVQWGTPVPV